MLSILTTFLAASSIAFAAPTAKRRLSINSFEGETVANSYIVKLKSGASLDAHHTRIFRPSVDEAGVLALPAVTHKYDLFNGYAGKLSKAELDAILEDENVEYVQPNGIMHAFETQDDAPWGLQSISSKKPTGKTDTDALDYTYSFDKSAGEGVDIYIIDTGIFVEHDEFEGRATFGWAAKSYKKADGNGHGTHCAGTAAGKTFGVAKKASLIAIKVLSDEGSGETADIVEGIDWMIKQVKDSGKPTVASMSLGGSADQALDDAVSAAIEAGIMFTIAAGNENVDAGTTSPARVPTALTVGASDISNVRAEFSNFGKIVDIFAPGVDITSSWIGKKDATNKISGTSMATPHMAGLSAYLLGLKAVKPAELVEQITSLGTSKALTDIPKDTINLLAFNGFDDSEEPEPTTTGKPTSTATETEEPTETATEEPTETATEEPTETDEPTTTTSKTKTKTKTSSSAKATSSA